MPTKRCRRCGEDKPVTAFPLAQFKKDGKREGDGYRTVCIRCETAKAAERKAKWDDGRKKTHTRYMVNYCRQWRSDKPWYMKAYAANLHAQRVGANGTITHKQAEQVWKEWDGKCWVCSEQATELDHFRPINGKSGGTNTPDNIRPICRECNQKRSHKWHGAEIAEKEAGLLRQIKTLLNEAK